eukprot:Awhi_evm1s12052
MQHYNKREISYSVALPSSFRQSAVKSPSISLLQYRYRSRQSKFYPYPSLNSPSQTPLQAPVQQTPLQIPLRTPLRTPSQTLHHSDGSTSLPLSFAP